MKKKAQAMVRLDEETMRKFKIQLAINNDTIQNVLENAIKNYIEGEFKMKNLKELKKFAEELEEGLVVINTIYIKGIGKCVTDGDNHIEHSREKFSCKILNNERKDEEGTIYNLENAVMEIDYNNEKVNFKFTKRWIGGLVETVKNEHVIKNIVIKKDSLVPIYRVTMTLE